MASRRYILRQEEGKYRREVVGHLPDRREHVLQVEHVDVLVREERRKENIPVQKERKK
jgi:hypothetical protein